MIEVSSSGVQRLLDARGQRGSWMPSNIFYSSPKISYDLFSLLPNFSHFFASVLKFKKVAPLMPSPTVLLLHHAPVTTFVSSFSSHLLTFLRNLAPWMPPPGWMLGAVAPSAPPLHATGVKRAFW